MTKYRKGPTKEHKTGPQRIGNHEKTARLATILFNFLKILSIFVIFYFFVFFGNFGVLMNCGGLQNDHSETPAHLSKDASIISMVQEISCIAGAHRK